MLYKAKRSLPLTFSGKAPFRCCGLQYGGEVWQFKSTIRRLQLIQLHTSFFDTIRIKFTTKLQIND
jgi:hypothetical protein